MRAGLLLVTVMAAVGAGNADATARQRATGVEDDRGDAALKAVRSSEQTTIADQVRLCEIPAPPFGERARALVVRDALHAVGLKTARLDRAGNVVAERRGRAERPNLLLAAHLDTVFPAGTPVKVTRDGAILRGPGIGDNCRGLAVLIAVARALNVAGVETEGSITFAATVGEEGLGDLRGVKALLAETLKGRVDRFVALDGSGSSITNVGVGSRRYRVTFRGSGGHSYYNFGRANPAYALSRAVARISELTVPSRPKTTFNVGRIGGGTSINAIPEESWMEVDLRSADEAALAGLEVTLLEIVNQAAAAENARVKPQGMITAQSERVGVRPAGRTDDRSAIVETALSISKTLAMNAQLAEGSNDANVPMQLGIPAIAIGAGGRGTGAHSRQETFDTTSSVSGTARALLLAIALSRR